MRHKVFVFASIFVLCAILPIIGLFDYFDIVDTHLTWRKLILKGIPLTLYILLTFLYFKIYRLSIYGIFLQATLYFCLLGDMFILFRTDLYFILSGVFFFIARILMAINFMVHPFSKFRFIRYSLRKTIISHVCFNLPYLTLGVVGVVIYKNLLSYLILSYIFLGFGFQQSYAFLRIGELEKETEICSLLGFLGISLFNISDLLLFLSLFDKSIPYYVKVISTDIYWIAIYLLTVSIVRTSCIDAEKGDILEYKNEEIIIFKAI